MYQYEKEFDFVIQRAKSLNRRVRAVIAGAELENMMHAVFEAESEGIIHPILVGSERKIVDLLDRLGYRDRNYDIAAVNDYEMNDDYHVYMKKALSIINDGLGDILVRGNTSTRNFLMPILDKKYNMVESLVSEVALIKVPYYNKLMALCDVSVLINPSEGQRKKIVKNMVDVLNHLGIEHPKIAVMALVEKPSFHMRDTVEAQNIVRSHRLDPTADCELVGPIPWDLIVSKEAARLKNYDCPYCGEFDGVVMPNLIAANTTMKVLSMSPHVSSCGVLAGTRVPVAMESRSSSKEQCFLSLCVATAMLNDME